MLTRVKTVDILRGIAVLWMVWFQTWDFFSRDFVLYNLDKRDWNRLGFDFFNWLPIFMTVSGISLFLSFRRKYEGGYSKFRIWIHGLRRYGGYIFLGLLICLWVADITLFLEFGEVVGAIGLYALISLTLLLFFHKHTFWLMVGIWIFSLALREYVSNYCVGMIISPFFYGFTIWLMLPYFAAGIFLADKILTRKFKVISSFCFLTLISALFSIFLFSPKISYFEGTTSFVLLSLSTVSFILCLIMKYSELKIFKLFEFFGKHALFFYVYHVAVLYKLVVVFNISKSLDFLTSIIVTAISLCIGSVIIQFYGELWKLTKSKFKTLIKGVFKFQHVLTIKGCG